MTWLDESEEKARVRYERWKASHELTGAHAIAYVELLEAQIEHLQYLLNDAVTHGKAGCERIKELEAEQEKLHLVLTGLSTQNDLLIDRVLALESAVTALRDAESMHGFESVAWDARYAELLALVPTNEEIDLATDQEDPDTP